LPREPAAEESSEGVSVETLGDHSRDGKSAIAGGHDGVPRAEGGVETYILGQGECLGVEPAMRVGEVFDLSPKGSLEPLLAPENLPELRRDIEGREQGMIDRVGADIEKSAIGQSG
jgi:hypothetical protein